MHGKMAPIRSSSFGIKLVFTWFCYAVMMYFAKIIWEISQLQMIRPIGRSHIVIPRTGTQFLRPFGQRTPSTETLAVSTVYANTFNQILEKIGRVSQSGYGYIRPGTT